MFFFNEDRAKELILENLEIKNGKKNFCIRCGKEISHGAKHCSECTSLISRKVDRPSREELKELIREKPFTHIAREYSVSDNAIKKRCIFYNLPSKKSEINKISEAEWLKI